MPTGLDKRGIPIGLGLGLDTKTDPKQVVPGKMVRLVNVVFNKLRQYTKRNGYAPLGSAPWSVASSILSMGGELCVLADRLLYSYVPSIGAWLSKGSVTPCSLGVQAVYRSSSSQSNPDCAVHESGLAVSAWDDDSGVPQYVVTDTTTGQRVGTVHTLPSTATQTRCFALDRHLIVTYLVQVGGAWHIHYVAIPVLNPTSPLAPRSLTSQVDLTDRCYAGSTGVYGLDDTLNLYVVWNASTAGGAVKMTYLDSQLQQHNTITIAGMDATRLAVWQDGLAHTIWVAGVTSAGAVYYFIRDTRLIDARAPQTIATGQSDVVALTGYTYLFDGKVFWERSNAYPFGSASSDYIMQTDVRDGVYEGTPSVFARSVGLASRAFVMDGNSYVCTVQASALQPTYFVLDSSGRVVTRLAYSNGGGYTDTGVVSGVTVSGATATFAYLRKDLLTTTHGQVYTQAGVNLAVLEFDARPDGVDVGQNLNITGGVITAYDGATAVEQNFFLYPEDIDVSTTGSTGLANGTYFYYVVFQWTDAKGNLHQSAPSVVAPSTTGLVITGGPKNVVLKIPTLRLTSKTDVSVAVYRQSAAQPIPYRATSITSPLLNDPTVDYVTFTDTSTDTQISGNDVLYTFGGVSENSAPPSSSIMTEWGDRLWVVDAEDPNVLWFSKQIIESVPVEFSQEFTQYVNPILSRANNTGPIRAAAGMDDKMIAFKANAIAYFTGIGPNNTGADNDFGTPQFITATVGCSNPKSIALIPTGLIFQSTNKGIWLLRRDLQTEYIGADVAAFNDATVTSAQLVPGTNQVRLTLDTGVALSYDYFVGQWAEFDNHDAAGAVVYGDLFTYVQPEGQVMQETPGLYSDNGRPVRMALTTSWLNFAGLQGYQRIYSAFLLGEYVSPHLLRVSVATDFATAPDQAPVITPDNAAPAYGDLPVYGDGDTYGGPSISEQWEVFITQQKCQSIQLTIEELTDPANPVAGAGLTLSGLLVLAGLKGTYPRLAAKRSVG